MDARKTKTSSPFLSSRSKPKRSVYLLVFLKIFIRHFNVFFDFYKDFIIFVNIFRDHCEYRIIIFFKWC